MRWFGIGDFGNVAKAGLLQVFEQGLEVCAARFVNSGRRVLVNPGPRIDECAEKPRPDGALMIRAVALAHAALIARRIAGFTGREGPQTQRRPEMIFHRFDDEEGAVVLDEAEGQTTDGEDLVWAE